jgi:uncharacterized protein
MDPTKTHGAPSWSELMTSDPAAASAFYGALFGWKMEVNQMGMGPYHLAKVGETSVAGVMGFPPGAQGMPPSWGCYVTVDNVDQTLERCTGLGGKVLMPPMQVPGVGRMAVIQDPQGATLNVITYDAA